MKKSKKHVDINRLALWASLLIPIGIMLLIFIANRIYPFGDRSFVVSDMYHQYVPFFKELLGKIRSGESLAFSYEVGIGSNFMALFVYYLASPLHIFALLVPEKFLIEFMSYLIVFKIGLAGMTAYIYLRKHFERSDWTAILFSCFYALSGFVAAYNYNIMWIDCVVLLPLIMLGLERLVKEGRCGLYCVTLAISIFTNFYISIMICIFLVLYFLLLLVTEKGGWKCLWNFALFSLLAGGMAAILLIPEVCAILETDFGDMDFPKTIESYFSVLDMLGRHCMCVFTHRGLDHWPNIYCGSAIIMLVPMYLLNMKISIREKFVRLVLIGFMLISFSTNMLDFIWHGLNYPDSFPARQSFIYVLLVLTICYDAFLHVKETKEQHILYGYLCAVGYLLYCEKFVEHEDFQWGVKLLTLVVISVYAILLWLYRTRENRELHKMLAVVAVTVVIAESFTNTIVTSVGTVSRSDYLAQLEDYESLYEMTKEKEDSLYRLEKFTRRTKNDAILAGYPSASLFSSTLNSRVMDMYKLLGMRHSKVYYAFDGATALTSALLNVKYMYGSSEMYANDMYRLVGQSNDVYLYENTKTLPFGYVAPAGFDFTSAYRDHGIRVQNEVPKLLDIEGTLFKQIGKTTFGDEIIVKADKSAYYYAIFTDYGTNKMKMVGGSTGVENYEELTKGSICYLGYLEEGDSVTLCNGNEEDTTPDMSLDIYRLNESVFDKILEKLSAQHLENVTWESDYLSGEVTLQEAGRLILSIPGEDGWKVLLNGEEVEYELFGGALMAFDLEPGHYELEMTYVPEGSRMGIAVSAGSVLLFVIVMLWRRRKIRLTPSLPQEVVE